MVKISSGSVSKLPNKIHILSNNHRQTANKFWVPRMEARMTMTYRY